MEETKNIGKGGWGQGFDYLFRDLWEELDQIYQDNIEGKHNPEKINHIFPLMKNALEKAAPIMEELCGKEKDTAGLKNWKVKLSNIINLFDTAETLNDKVIAIDCADQFLRACY